MIKGEKVDSTRPSVEYYWSMTECVLHLSIEDHGPAHVRTNSRYIESLKRLGLNQTTQQTSWGAYNAPIWLGQGGSFDKFFSEIDNIGNR